MTTSHKLYLIKGRGVELGDSISEALEQKLAVFETEVKELKDREAIREMIRRYCHKPLLSTQRIITA